MADQTPIVSLEVALAHLREDAGVADDLIKIYIGAATQSASDYVDRKLYANDAEMQAAVADATAGADPIVANDAIRAAILFTIGKLYAFREDVVSGASASVTELPSGAKSLLFPYRVGLGV